MTMVGDESLQDAIISQLDGGDSSSSSYEYEYDVTKPMGFLPKRPRIESSPDTSCSGVSIDVDMDLEDKDNDEESISATSSSTKGPIIESVTNSEDPVLVEDSSSNSAATEELHVETESQFGCFQIPANKVVTKDGRKLVVIPNTGKSFIMTKSNKKFPASIWRHCNDILTMSQVETSIRSKPCLCLYLDDGADWGKLDKMIPLFQYHFDLLHSQVAEL